MAQQSTTFELIAAERLRLAAELEQLTPEDWASPSLCEGWDNHTVAAHLNLPWAMSKAQFALAALRQRGNIEKTMDVSSRSLAARLSPAGCVAGLRDHADDRFVAPTMPPEAPLTDVIMHGADILAPLGRSVSIDPAALTAMLDFLLTKPAQRAFRAGSVAGLRLEATDVDWSWEAPSPTATVSGPALSLAGAMVGRPFHRTALTGDGLALLT